MRYQNESPNTPVNTEIIPFVHLDKRRTRLAEGKRMRGWSFAKRGAWKRFLKGKAEETPNNVFSGEWDLVDLVGIEPTTSSMPWSVLARGY